MQVHNLEKQVVVSHNEKKDLERQLKELQIWSQWQVSNMEELRN
jgi:predicted site-specific integrase-resolvase